MLGRSGAEFFHPDDLALRAASIRRIADGLGARTESRLRTADGSWRWMAGQSQPLLDEDRRTIGVVSSWHPIDEEVAGREALRATEALVKSIVDASPDSIAVTDASGTVQFVTPGAAEVFRFTPSQVPIGRSFLEFVAPREQQRAGAALRDLIVNGPSGHGAYTCVRGDGTSFDAEIAARPVRTPGGTITGVVFAIRDITERKEAERRLRESEERAAEARRLEALGRLAGGVAHDFNNILLAINGTAEMLASSLALDDPRREDAVAIQEAGARAAALTAQLLAFGRRQVLRPMVLDIGAVLAEIGPMLRRTMGADVALRIDVASGGVAVRVDRSQLEQVIVNLVFNARDAMPNGGAVTVAAHIAAVESPPADSPVAGQPGRYACLRVADTGTGIDAAILARVFEPFFTTKERGRGTGLGLATAAGVVAQSGGWIEVATALGEGSTFSVYLPLADAEPAEMPIEEPQSKAQCLVDPRTAKRLVLLVDDDAAVRTACAKLLTGLGYGVLDEHSPEAALALSDEALKHIDIIVSDIVMPEMDGITMSHLLRERRPGLPVIFMSGHTPDPRAQQHLAERGVSFLAKPFTRGALDAAVRRLLDA
jgi:PAS domain S-box-containing protein